MQNCCKFLRVVIDIDLDVRIVMILSFFSFIQHTVVFVTRSAGIPIVASRSLIYIWEDTRPRSARLPLHKIWCLSTEEIRPKWWALTPPMCNFSRVQAESRNHLFFLGPTITSPVRSSILANLHVCRNIGIEMGSRTWLDPTWQRRKIPLILHQQACVHVRFIYLMWRKSNVGLLRSCSPQCLVS